MDPMRVLSTVGNEVRRKLRVKARTWIRSSYHEMQIDQVFEKMSSYEYQPSSSGVTDTVLGVGDATDRGAY